MNDNIKSLEREVELLKQLVELKTKLLEFESANPTYVPYIPTYPIYPSFPCNPVIYPWVTYTTGTSATVPC